MAAAEAEASAEAVAADPMLAPGGILAREPWCVMVARGLSAGSAITGIKSLATDLGEPVHREALEALYDSFADVPALHFMLKPGGKWMGRAVAVGMWAVPMAVGVREELRARRRVASVGPQPSGQPAAPPAGDDLGTMAEFNAAMKAAA